MTEDAAGWQDSIPALDPVVRVSPVGTAYVMLGVIIPNAIFIDIPPGDETWTEMVGSATSHTEMTVAATAWTELT